MTPCLELDHLSFSQWKGSETSLPACVLYILTIIFIYLLVLFLLPCCQWHLAYLQKGQVLRSGPQDFIIPTSI